MKIKKSRAQIEAEIREALGRPLSRGPIGQGESLAAFVDRVERESKVRQKRLHQALHGVHGRSRSGRFHVPPQNLYPCIFSHAFSTGDAGPPNRIVHPKRRGAIGGFPLNLHRLNADGSTGHFITWISPFAGGGDRADLPRPRSTPTTARCLASRPVPRRPSCRTRAATAGDPPTRRLKSSPTMHAAWPSKATPRPGAPGTTAVAAEVYR